MLIPFQPMYIFVSTVVMFLGGLLISIAVYKMQVDPVNGRSPISIVNFCYRLIKDYPFCCSNSFHG